MTEKHVLISVVVPTYNYAHYLPRALDSVLCQWEEGLELIIVDDGSTDSTEALLADYVARYPFMRVVRQVNSGAAAARNHGILMSHGDYVLPLDADDELMPSAISVLRTLLVAAPGTDIVLGAHFSVSPDGRERLRPPTPVPVATARQLAKAYLLEKRIAMSHSCTLFRRELLLKRPYPQTLRAGEDIPVFAFLLVNGKVAITPQPIAKIFKHADSLRNSRSDEEALALAVVQEVFATLPAQCQSLRSRYEAQRYLSLFRAALLAKDRPTARRFYSHALGLSPLQALRWTYFRKASRLLFKA